MSVLAVDLDRLAATHLAFALRDRRAAYAGYAWPPALVGLQELAERAATKGHEGTQGDTSLATLSRLAEHGGHGELLLQTEVAAILGCSARTVRRMIGRGELASVPSGSARRVPCAALEAYLVTRQEG